MTKNTHEDVCNDVKKGAYVPTQQLRLAINAAKEVLKDAPGGPDALNVAYLAIIQGKSGPDLGSGGTIRPQGVDRLLKNGLLNEDFFHEGLARAGTNYSELMSRLASNDLTDRKAAASLVNQIVQKQRNVTAQDINRSITNVQEACEVLFPGVTQPPQHNSQDNPPQHPSGQEKRGGRHTR